MLNTVDFVNTVKHQPTTHSFISNPITLLCHKGAGANPSCHLAGAGHITGSRMETNYH